MDMKDMLTVVVYHWQEVDADRCWKIPLVVVPFVVVHHDRNNSFYSVYAQNHLVNKVVVVF